MSDNIKLSNPAEVLAHITRISDIFEKYQENLQAELNAYGGVENYITETKQIVNDRKRRLEIALEQTKKGNSEAARRSAAGIQAKIEKCNEKIRNINQCLNDYTIARQDETMVANESTELSNTAKLLSVKITRLITDIMELK